MKLTLRFLIVIALAAAPARAQDFKRIAELVVQMESSLKSMISHEETQRKAEVAELRSEITGLRASLSAAAPQPRSAPS